MGLETLNFNIEKAFLNGFDYGAKRSLEMVWLFLTYVEQQRTLREEFRTVQANIEKKSMVVQY